MKDHITSSCSTNWNDFVYTELAGKGGMQKAWGLFETGLNALLGELSKELVA